MYYFINCLRALAATLITNAHYTNVYPISIIANGGLLGDILFFAVSGFCLYNIKLKFIPWYKKRISRIYPSVIIVTGVYILMKFYTYNGIKGLFNLLIYPTKYHFVISIMILYIFYYFTIILSRKNENITIDRVFFMTIIIQFIVYVVIYDKSYYHIDSVYEPMIRFLFFEAMLIGAKFNELKFAYINRKESKALLKIIVTFIIYFASKLVFSKYQVISQYQILNQYIILLLMVYIFKYFISIENKIKQLPKSIYRFIKLISDITLEIYLVQSVIIAQFENYIFPVNFIVITLTILISAYLVYTVKNKLFDVIDHLR
ncbi:acyltransferase family protein [uncultured Intestinibacter sp.]|uniref:acyltransferase family protein n=1 Tax=uncultured Intestinibacter sp. TaxID=1505659 RepID=UPI0027DDD630|nr:acyltransferase family protein [uncultured Intestinibacter sp.]